MFALWWVLLAVACLAFAFVAFSFFKWMQCNSRRSADDQTLASLSQGFGLDSRNCDLAQTTVLTRQLIQFDGQRWKWATVIHFVFLLLGITGLVLFPSLAEESRSRSILITTPDGQSRNIPMESDNLKLSDALTAAGTAASTQQPDADDDDYEEPMLIGIKRSEDGQQNIYYYPASMVWSGAPGALRVKEGDSIVFRTLDQTSLGVMDITDEGVNFSVSGMIERPGDYETVEFDEVIMNIHTESYAQSFESSQSGPDVLILRRQMNEAAPIEHYFIPITEPFIDPILLDSRIRKGDRFEYSRIDTVLNP